MSEEHVEGEFAISSEPGTEDGDMARLVLQHSVMPAYQFIIQVGPEQTSVTQVNHINVKNPASVLQTHKQRAYKQSVLLLLYTAGL